MALTHELITLYQSYKIGDIKAATYDITFTANQLVEPANDQGWFLLNGAVITRATYPILFARYGTSFNTGGETGTQFRLPNHAEGVSPIGKGVTNFPSYAASGGEINHTLLNGTGATEIPTHLHGTTLGVSANSHSHSGSAGTDNGGGHTHTYTLSNLDKAGPAGGTILTATSGGSAGGNGGGSHTHTVTSLSYGTTTETFNKSGRISDTAAGAGHNNMMPYIVIGGLLVKYG